MPDHFRYQQGLFRPFIRGLLRTARIAAGSSVLDVGCGQGFFSHLLHGLGMKVVGVDFSEVAIRTAHETYRHSGIDFIVSDALALPLRYEFDCVFTRSLSLYNTESFAFNREVTSRLLEHVRPGGSFLFVYNSNLGRSHLGGAWFNHRLDHVRKHFEAFTSTGMYFISRIDCAVLGRRAFDPFITTINAWLSERLAMGGEIVCIIQK